MIRRATVDDRLPAIRMMKDFHAAGAMPFPFQAAVAERLFLDFVDAPRRAIFVIDDGGAKGLLIAEAGDHPFGFVLAREVLWWIDPDARGRSAIQMLDAYEAWAKAEGCAFASAACLGADERTARLYSRRGFKPAETHFLKAI